ncbi:MAG TPA: tetratricopeptide repeat protein [Kiritimatiellia bacterium]|nr:tetratricopeptide repeat protein [Kiritimatiellia bacterium]HQF20832.1 tetratricopeptide repeat protein [Kiritimatiellia bacterium]HQG74856.1 tetratricopeptide repeat protein [Kiritimatiellia bacterium]
MNLFTTQRDLPPLLTGLLRWLRRLGIAAVALVVVYLVLEVICAYALPQCGSRFLVPGEVNGEPVWRDNPFFAYRFYPPRTAPAPLPIVARQTPAPGTLRVCLLGGDALMGEPEPSFGPGRQLELMLRQRYPDHPVEVIHLTLEGGNSHIMREVARDLERLRPQAVVIMIGNEEIAGPYGPASTLGWFHHSARLARTLVLFSRTHVSQLFAGLVGRVAPARVDLNVWRSQEPLMLKGRLAPDDPRLKSAYRAFNRNLRAILRLAKAAAPEVIVCTVPVNLRNCDPFLTTYLPDEAAAQQVRETLRNAIAADAAGAPEAARLYADVIRRNPTHAEALFRAARLALADGRRAEAFDFFVRARDADSLRLRTDSRQNQMIRTAAEEAGVSLLDLEKHFALSSPKGVPGHEFFLDHVHFTFAGANLLAAAVLARLESRQAFDAIPTGALPDAPTLATELLYDPWGHAAVLKTVLDQQLRPPFNRQVDNAAYRQELMNDRQAAEARVTSLSAANTKAILKRRLALAPADGWLAARAGWYLFNAGATNEAIAAAESAHQLWPHRYEPRALLAFLQTVAGAEADESIAFLKGADYAGYYDVNWALRIGEELTVRGLPLAARPWLEYALARDPWNSAVAIALSQALQKAKLGQEAVDVLQAAIKRNPQNPLLWEELAALYCVLGRWKLSTQCFNKVEEIAPFRYERFYKWADALVRLKQYSRALGPINRYLAAMPDDPEGRALLAIIKDHIPAGSEPPQDNDDEKPTRKLPWE